MLPVLIKIGPLELHSYGLLVVLGFFVSVTLLRQKSNRVGVNRAHMSDAAFWSFLASLLGARLLFVVIHWGEFSKAPLIEILEFWRGGMVFYGGLVTGAIVFLALTRWQGISSLKALDLAAPSLALAHFFGRIGCFLAGCCYGRACDLNHPLAVTFTDPRSLAPSHLPLHPAQLYDATNVLIIFAITETLFWKRRFDGQVVAVYLVLYGIGRWVVETYRGDAARGFVFDGLLSTSQAISIVSVTIGVLVWVIGRRSRRTSLQTNEAH